MVLGSDYFILYSVYFIFGAIIGSFLNVVILRFGTGRGLGGRSSCGTCNRTLTAVDLVPIISYLALRGRCRTCHARISPQYMLVEALTGVLFVLVSTQYAGLELVLAWGITALGIAIAVYDALHMRIPVMWNYALIAVSVAFVASSLSLERMVDAALGCAIVAGFFLITYVVSRGRVLGFGDVILAISIGTVLGALDGLFAVWVACVVGSCVGVYQIVRDAAYRTSTVRSLVQHHVPFGPFLLIGFMIVFLHGFTFDTFMSGIAPDMYL